LPAHLASPVLRPFDTTQAQALVEFRQILIDANWLTLQDYEMGTFLFICMFLLGGASCVVTSFGRRGGSPPPSE
jgi:hypothetical protein